MKKLSVIIIFGFIYLSMISCQTKKGILNLESRFYTDSIYSNFLSEYRKHKIYLPKGFNKKKKYPIIYATDGNSDITQKKHALDSLINNKIIKPVIFIASYSNDKIVDSTSIKTGDGKKVYLTYRNFEYVNRKDSLLANRFQNHMLYFIDELIPQVEKNFNQNLNKKDRHFYGVSNGAGFGLSLLNTYPNTIGTYICFSTFGGDIQTNTWQKDVKYPNLYLYYGSEEPFFLKIEAEFLKSKYKELNLTYETKEYNGGHSNKNWSDEFNKIVSKLIKTN
ncbi:esterase [Flavobacterium enshiense DK69]|uniref:Esterase n=1 Tax=Flavobacterium enshiense DK69 TaxID=1107311 RepID=V6S0R8_9FLAO|nr:alpha/beta hydrolase-fold protein [Flavobacterium enshiense]ESU19862.1 esterase [Flavobacterium enshiense DK69]KGO92298.1 esterase [Flavobacterium enshiense DK69]